MYIGKQGHRKICTPNFGINIQRTTYIVVWVKKEWRKLENIHFGLHILPRILNSTVKSFSEARNICRNCCVPISECQNQTKTTICVHNKFCRYSELTIFMKCEQSVVILWVSWCKNKSFWQIFTCTYVLYCQETAIISKKAHNF